MKSSVVLLFLFLCSYPVRVILASKTKSENLGFDLPAVSTFGNLEGSLTQTVQRTDAIPTGTTSDIYNQVLAEEMVAYASAASCVNKSLIEDWECKVCLRGNGKFIGAPPSLSDVVVFEDKERVNQAFVGFDHKNHRIIVSFQGTVNIKETLEDLDVIPVESYCAKCEVHSGFFNAFMSIGDRIVSFVKQYSKRYKSKRVFLTGHSLGAAMACHAALHLKASNQDYNLVGYTFGQPRLGNEHFSNYMHEMVPSWFRIVNYKDPIPALLPKIDSLFYHTTTEVWYYEKPKVGQPPGKFRICNQTNGEDPKCQDRVCPSIFFCINGKYHNTYMNLESLTNPDMVC